MSRENIDQNEGSLLEAIDRLHKEDRCFYRRLVYQEKRFNVELVREINYLLKTHYEKNENLRSRGRGWRMSWA